MFTLELQRLRGIPSPHNVLHPASLHYPTLQQQPHTWALVNNNKEEEEEEGIL